MFISFVFNTCECHDDKEELDEYVKSVKEKIEQELSFISIKIRDNNVFWDIKGNPIPIENITNFHPELIGKIEAFINAYNEFPDIMRTPVQTGLNVAQYMALKCRYEMYGYAIVDMVRMIYPNHIIVLEPL